VAMHQLREACATVAGRSSHVGVIHSAIAPYAAAVAVALAQAPTDSGAKGPDPTSAAGREQRAARWLTLDAVNFGSGWFPTLRKRPGRSGYDTISTALFDRFDSVGAWTATELAGMDAAALGPLLGQDPEHELMGLYATSLRDLGGHVEREHAGQFTQVVDAADGSAVTLALGLGAWRCFSDCSRHGELEIAFLKRAQIAAADLQRAGVAEFADLCRLTMFADNLVPHVLRLDGVLRFSDELVGRIEHEELIEHGSPPEVEIRACAVHAVELLVAAGAAASAAELDQFLWQRGRQPRYKASPRHRTRCTAY
jgi:hypothetical protein